MRLVVLPTARAVSHHIQIKLTTNQILDKTITIATFFEKAILVKDKVLVDSNSRVLLLNESIDFDKIKKLGFERDFLSFIKNSEFIFKFFDEIFAENISLDDINTNDIYGEFSDHIEILTYVYNEYKKNLQAHNYYDRATIDTYTINKNFFKNYSHIDIYLEGFLTNIEFDVVQNIASEVQTFVHIEYNHYNHKMVSKFLQYGIEINKYGKYILDISNKRLYDYSILSSCAKFEIASFSSAILQCAFVFKKIYDFVEVQGYDPEKIAVILPNESFATVLENFDTHNNLNFAMGKDFATTLFYQKLQAIFLYIVEPNKENTQRIDKLSLQDTIQTLKTMQTQNKLEQLLWLIDTLKQSENETIQEIINNILYKIDKFAKKLHIYKLRELLSFSLRLFGDSKLDDVGGGKIKVIGVLESRNISFDAVIIVSFNEGVVPKISTKDIFLNSKIKSFVNLPTTKDREELQKYYYARLFSNTKEVAISYISNDESSPSRFLKELNLQESILQDDKYKYILFNQPAIIKHYNKTHTIENSWIDSELSATRLTTFLTCKQKFYLSYVKNLKPPTEQDKDKLKVGLLFHNAFNTIIDSSYSNYKKLQQDIKDEVLKNLDDVSIKFDVYKWLKYLDDFCKYEVSRFDTGYSIYEKEQSYAIDYNGIKLTGRIDRVDIRDDKLCIIDYKLQENLKIDTKRNYEKTKDFQLEFYYLLIKEKYKKEIDGVYLYDIKNTKLVPEEMLYEKLSMLDEKIEEYKQPILTIEKCEERANCRYCHYSTICDRD